MVSRHLAVAGEGKEAAMTHEREEAWVAYWEGDANTHNYKRDVERAYLAGYDAREAVRAVPPASKILGNCDNSHLVMPHTKCNECLNWKPEAAPAVPERKPLNNSSWKNCGHPVFLGTSKCEHEQCVAERKPEESR